MQILSLNVIEYASMKNRSFDLTAGLNIIEGENESGKSTLLSFIKFMLYGLPRRSSGEVVTEKERSFSWDNGVAAGSMTVRLSDGDYRIERSARDGVRGEKLNIIRLSDGAPVHKGEIPGELFLGAPLSVFESSACVKQLGCTSLDGAELSGAIENLLISADETLDTEKASSKIDSVRRKLLHKTKKGGSIYELTLKKEALETRLEDAKQKSGRIMEYESSYENLVKLCSDSRARLAESKILCDAHDRRQLLIKIESMKSARARTEAIEKDILRIKNERCHGGFIPSSDYLRELALAEKDFATLSADFTSKKAALNDAESIIPHNNEKSRFVFDIEELGGRDVICAEYKKAKKTRESSKALGIIFLILALLSSALIALSVLPITLPSFLSFLAKGVVSSVLISATALLIGVAVFCFTRSHAGAGKEKKIKDTFSLTNDVSAEELYSYLGECIEADRVENDARNIIDNAKKELALSDMRLGESRQRLFRLLSTVGKEPDITLSPNQISSICAEVIKDSSEISAELGELEKDLAKYKALLEEREKETTELDEKELSESLTPELLKKLSETNVTMLRREYDFLRSKTETAEQKKYFYDRELIGLRATAENPLKVEALLDNTRKRLNEEIYAHDALTLAFDTIKEASESMRRNVTPRLRAHAGEIMGILTDGKYTELGISPDFTITVNAGGITRPIEALSAGTRDAAYLSVRLALISVLYRGERPPMLLDEVLSQIDDKRAAAVLNMLSKYCADGTQCLLFSCHTRESGMVDANVVKL
ncbi:MAG: hypothetical protein E7671_01335 [Ruminococcaceae bacterium]|nr:hypothetical protein [Oscillospiraceae bacterium]